MMNPDLKAKWVAALRSGKYTQGVRALNKNNEYCCLGVLCEVLELPKQQNPLGGGEIAYGSPIKNDAWSAGTLPYGLSSELGLQGSNVLLPVTQQNLTTLNDRGKTFEEIAALIEREL